MKIKWLLFVLWLVSVLVFIYGQIIAPPNYTYLESNAWGNLFGITVVSGIIFFCVMIVFFVFIKEKNKKQKMKYPEWYIQIPLCSFVISICIFILLVTITFVQFIITDTSARSDIVNSLYVPTIVFGTISYFLLILSLLFKKLLNLILNKNGKIIFKKLLSVPAALLLVFFIFLISAGSIFGAKLVSSGKITNFLNSQKNTSPAASYPTSIPTASPIFNGTNPNTLVNCQISKECGGGSQQLKKSVCDSMTCCLYNVKCGGPKFVTKDECLNNSYCCLLRDGTGKLVSSKNACDNYYSSSNTSKATIIPFNPSANYYSCYLCYHYLSGDTCSYYNYSFKTKAECDAKQQEIDNTYYPNKSPAATTPKPTLSPEEEQALINELAKAIEECWNQVDAYYDQQVHTCTANYGSSPAAEACIYLVNQDRQKDLDACELK